MYSRWMSSFLNWESKLRNVVQSVPQGYSLLTGHPSIHFVLEKKVNIKRNIFFLKWQTAPKYFFRDSTCACMRSCLCHSTVVGVLIIYSLHPSWGGGALTKSTASYGSSHFAFYRYNYHNLIASLSHLEALCLNVTSDALSNCLF